METYQEFGYTYMEVLNGSHIIKYPIILRDAWFVFRLQTSNWVILMHFLISGDSIWGKLSVINRRVVTWYTV